MSGRLFGGVCALLCAGAQTLHAVPQGTATARLGLEARYFTQAPLYAGQAEHAAAVFAGLDGTYTGADPRWYARARLFGRYDSVDRARRHFDVREAALVGDYPDWTVTLGVDRVAWGVVESNKLVDVINQIDAVERPDGSVRLGQPLAAITRRTDFGNFTGMVLPYFRRRDFPGVAGRLRPPVPVGHAEFEAREGERHVDWAGRYSLNYGPLDLGLSFFSGTERDPRFVVGERAGRPVLTPRYELIDLPAVDAQLSLAGWLLKLEVVHNARHRDHRLAHSAAVGGVEYTFGDVLHTGLDFGVLAEYAYDERGETATTLYDDDVFLAARVSLNDEAGTEGLLGVVLDRHRHTRLYRARLSTRVHESLRLSLEAFAVADAPESDALPWFLRNDDFVQVELTYFTG